MVALSRRVESLTAFHEVVNNIGALHPETAGLPSVRDYLPTRYVWRGVSDSNWTIDSSLHREFVKQFRETPDEASLQLFEKRLIGRAREWRLDWHPSGGRLHGLDLLARLQHHGIPTRLIDVTTQPLIALWFAVNEREH